MSWVVQQPNSNTNDSDKYRVTWYQDWINYINGAKTSYGFVQYDTYEEAKAYADEMNGINCQNR